MCVCVSVKSNCVVSTCVSHAEARLRYIGWTSVCPYVRPSHAGIYCIKTAAHIVMLSSPHDSTFILVLCDQDLREIPTGALNRGGV